MNQRVDMPENLRDEMESIMDYRYRTCLLGEIQFLIADIYFLYQCNMHERMFVIITGWILQLNELYVAVTDRDNPDTTMADLLFLHDHNNEFVSEQNDQPFESVFWTAMHGLITVIHMVSAYLVIRATKQNTPKLRAVRFCKLVQAFNCIFFAFDITMFALCKQVWYVTIILILYRFIFIYNVNECWKTIDSLAPTPPGHTSKGFWTFNFKLL